MGVNSGELPDILRACFPRLPTGAGAIHPLQPELPAFNEEMTGRGHRISIRLPKSMP